MSKRLKTKRQEATSPHTAESSEIWLRIVGFDAYEASNMGRVRRIAGGHGVVLGRVLKTKPHKAGYAMVDLSIKNRVTRMTVARCVALAFHGEPPSKKHQAAHWDGNPARDFPDNVRWATAKENSDDADRHGRRRKGSRHQNSKLIESDVKEIRRLRASGKDFKTLGKMFGVSASNAYEANVGKRQWSHV